MLILLSHSPEAMFFILFNFANYSPSMAMELKVRMKNPASGILLEVCQTKSTHDGKGPWISIGVGLKTFQTSE